MTQLSKTIIIIITFGLGLIIILICFDHEEKTIIDRSSLLTLDCISPSKIQTKKEKFSQVNLFINDSIKSFSLEKIILVGYFRRGKYFAVIGSKIIFYRRQKRDFPVSSSILAKPKETKSRQTTKINVSVYSLIWHIFSPK